MTTIPAVFKGQDAVRLILETKVDYGTYDVTSAKIWYRKPDGTEGSWTATKLLDEPALGKIYVDFTSVNNFNVKGSWILWSELIFADGRHGFGAPIKYYVDEKGQGY